MAKKPPLSPYSTKNAHQAADHQKPPAHNWRYKPTAADKAAAAAARLPNTPETEIDLSRGLERTLARRAPEKSGRE